MPIKPQPGKSTIKDGLKAYPWGNGEIRPTAVGLFQHRGSRFAKLKASSARWYTWQAQIDFALSEKIKGVKYGDPNKTYLETDFPTAAEATEWFTRNFERPEDPSLKSKQRIATVNGLEQDILDADKKVAALQESKLLSTLFKIFDVIEKEIKKDELV